MVGAVQVDGFESVRRRPGYHDEPHRQAAPWARRRSHPSAAERSLRTPSVVPVPNDAQSGHENAHAVGVSFSVRDE